MGSWLTGVAYRGSRPEVARKDSQTYKSIHVSNQGIMTRFKKLTLTDLTNLRAVIFKEL